MSGEAPLIGPIEGYYITVYREGRSLPLLVEKLKLGKVGGAHITNPEDLIMQIEIAVFKEEERAHND